MARERGEKQVAANRKARHEYFVEETYECGLVLDGFNDIQELDIIEAYKMVEVPR